MSVNPGSTPDPDRIYQVPSDWQRCEVSVALPKGSEADEGPLKVATNALGIIKGVQAVREGARVVLTPTGEPVLPRFSTTLKLLADTGMKVEFK